MFDTLFDFDFSAYRLRQLDPDHGSKPLDFAAGGISGSLTPEGRLIAVNAYHAQHGIITLTSVPPFADELRYDPQAVRAYRRSIATDAGFGLTFDQPIIARDAFLIEDAVPYLRLRLADGTQAECLTCAVESESGVQVIQRWRFSDPAIVARLTGRLRLMRAAYTQLTEGGVLPMPPVTTHVHIDQPARHSFILSNPALPAYAVCRGGAGLSAQPDGSVLLTGQPVALAADGQFELRIGLGADLQTAQAGAGLAASGMVDGDLLATLRRWRGRWADAPPADRLHARARVYALGCCVPVTDEATCILTDHMLLPLSWNRDSYYTALALLRWHAEGASMVRRHLIWLFEVAERDAESAWGRAYLANGRVKDRGFQFDQQLYPLLELADTVLHTGDADLLARLRPHVADVLAALRRRRHPDAWLFATDETPADDPIALPYHFSSHVLLWHTLNQLARVGLKAWDAVALKADIQRYFVSEWGGRQLYAYATDGAGRHHHYHDANDVPLALMPYWGACSADDPIWRATVDFAFSEANTGGCYAGRLGSVHTPAPWPLGDIQAWLIARARHDPAGAQAAYHQLQQAAQWDGALSEAYDAGDFSVVSRHWFAWPGAMLYTLDGPS